VRYILVLLHQAKTVGSNLTTGGLYKLSLTTRQDIGNPLVCERVTGWHDHGTISRKRCVRLRAVMRRGTAAQGATPGSLEVRVQDDDKPWSAWRQISVGTPSQHEQVKALYPGGVYRRRRYHTRFSNTEDISLVELHEEHEVLTT